MVENVTNPNQAALNYGEKCPVCGGTGWEEYTRIVEDPTYHKKPLIFANPCSRCAAIRRRYDSTGMPEEYEFMDITKFGFESYSVDMSKIKSFVYSFFNRFKEWNDKGKGLYIWSKTPGTGKTLLSCCVANSLTIKYGLKTKFITAPDYISLVGDSFKRERGESDASLVYREAELLVLDDIGAQLGNEWQRSEMFRLIDSRIQHGLVTIYTSNIPPEQLNVDERTKNRIIASSVVFSMPEESIRMKKAKAEQEEFLQKMLENI